MDRRTRWGRLAVAVSVALAATGLALASGPAPTLADANEAPNAPEAFRSLASGSAHSCAILRAGRVKCWGSGSGGRLGLGDTASRGDAAGEMGASLPAVDLGFGRTATALSAGATHTCALLDNGAVKCWGNNAIGRLGLGDTANRGDAAGEMGESLPAVSLGTGRTATAISAGNSHTCAVLDNGLVKCWGNNASGQLGLGDNLARGDAAGEMGNSLPAVSLGTGRTATAIAVGNGYSCALLDNATVKCWGNSASGQLGQGNTTQRGDNAGEMGNNLPAVNLGTGRTVTALTTGDTHTCALLDNHQVKCWGAGGSGRLGLGSTANRGDGAGEMGDNLPAVSLGDDRRATGLSAGEAHTCATLANTLTGATTVKCWGENASGQLGLGDTADRGDTAGEMGNSLFAVDLGTGRTATAVSAAGSHTCARLDNASVKCWGENSTGQLGLGNTADRGDGAGEMGDTLPAADLSPGRVALQVSMGSGHACALLDGGAVKCWGENGSGALGQGDNATRGDGPNELGDNVLPAPVGSGRTATSIAVGSGSSCALLDNGTVRCWGSNGVGQLGLGDTVSRGNTAGQMGDNLPAVDLGTGRTATAITARFDHVCALLDNGSIKCLGSNTTGQLGLGDTSARGDAPNEMGDNLPAVDLGTGRTATAISAGSGFTCALLDNGSVKCWGKNDSGGLGQGDLDVLGDGPNEMGDNLPAIDLGTGRTATAIATGTTHACAILDNATLKCWGAGSTGRLGLGDTANRGDGPNEMGDNLPAIDLGTGRTATAVSLGNQHTCARLDDGTVKCWGTAGRLGLGDNFSRGDNANEMGDNLPALDLGAEAKAISVAAGWFSTCAPLTNGTVKCWGSNGGGQLGIGDTDFRGDGPGQMGDALPAVDLGSANPLGVSGTVTATGSGAPVPGAFVALLRTTDFAIVGAAVADPAGNYAAEMPPGSYYAYGVDPSGRHAAGFAGAPTTANVTTPGLVDIDASLAPLRGSITGTIRESPSANPIPGAWAITLSASTGAPEIATQADAAGAYELDDLTAVDHYLGWLDPTGNHATRFNPSSPDVPSATPVAVAAGQATIRNGSLPIQAGTAGGAALTGTVTETGTNAPLANVLVIAMHAADFRLARIGVTTGTGSYNLDVAAGAYKLVFFDSSGLHTMEWHNNQPYTGIANAATVTAPTATNNTLDRSTGTLTGTLTDQTSGDPLPGAWAIAIDPTGAIAGAVLTKPNGTYTITGLAPGTYRATFVDPKGGRTQEYYDNSPDYTGGTNINITANTTTANINAALTRP